MLIKSGKNPVFQRTVTWPAVINITHACQRPAVEAEAMDCSIEMFQFIKINTQPVDPILESMPYGLEPLMNRMSSKDA